MPTRALVVLAAALAVAPPANAQKRPDLSGDWVLKDAPVAPDSAVEEDSTSPGPRSDLRPLVKRRGSPEQRQQLSRLVGMAQPVPGFRIDQTDSTVTFTNPDGFAYTVHTERGRDSVQVGEEWIWMRGRWRNKRLEVEVRPPGGGRIIESYELADSRLYLRLEVVVEHDLLAQRLWRPRMYQIQDVD